jgi:hypothetical protein
MEKQYIVTPSGNVVFVNRSTLVEAIKEAEEEKK